MADIIVPALGESVSEATIARWLKKAGEAVNLDEPIVELETDKVTLEVGSPVAGVLSEIKVPQGQTVAVGALLGHVNTGGNAVVSSQPAVPSSVPPISAPLSSSATSESEKPLSPAVRKLVDENRVNPGTLNGSGKDGRLTKGDVLASLTQAKEQTLPEVSSLGKSPSPVVEGGQPETRIRMTRLRQRIAERLKSAQNTAAILTTFNEIDMSEVMALRTHHKETFEKKHGVKLGFMSFFVKAAVAALKEITAVNAEIDGEDIVYKHYYDIGVAVGTEQGLVVPVLRGADQLSFAEIEKSIAELGKKARDGKLTMQDLTGGTFTISNGGVYGSLMSTPILNPPQSGILGMHKTQERPVVVNGEIKIRPMMYVAFSYDHRIIDGREAVTFLVRIKDAIENPERLLLEV